MKKLALSLFCAGLLVLTAVSGPVRGQSSPTPTPTDTPTGTLTPTATTIPAQQPPPPPPPNGGTPYPPISPPCSPAGCPTNTPTPTETPTATPTPSPTPSPTPVPLFVTVRLSHSTVKVGQKETIHVTTLPGAHVVIHVTFPHGKGKHHGGHADDAGAYSWSFKQPSGRTTSKSHTGHVIVKVDQGLGQSVTAGKKFKIK